MLGSRFSCPPSECDALAVEDATECRAEGEKGSEE